MITGLYRTSEFDEWSGWRDLTSHLLLTSQIDKMLCNINYFNYKNPMCLTSQTCENGLKSVQKCDLYKMTNFSSNYNYPKLIPILLQLNKFDNHSTV